MHVHEQVLAVANEIVSGRADSTFGVDEVVRALPHLNQNSVRTDIVSRCCVNAPKHHLHTWPYFRRVARGRYQVEPAYRRKAAARILGREGPKRAAGSSTARLSGATGNSRETIHAVIQRDESTYVAECLEVAVVTQGTTLDELVENLRQALALHLEDEDMAALGLVEHPRVQLIYDTAIAS
jgi:predicted RNase H-like HicB family nuclease